MKRERALAVLGALGRMTEAERARLLASLPAPAFRALEEEWWWQAHGGQREPDGDWRVWLIMAGRGFGKTRAGAEWVWARAREVPGARIALVGGSLDEVAKVMVEGESGLLAVARSGEAPRWTASRGSLLFPSGATAFAYSGERPGRLRGPQHHFAWCDELAKWARPAATWDNLMLGLRLGEAPRAMVTTTPRPGAILKRILGLKRTAITRGRTADNVHLPEDFRAAMTEIYGGTRLGRQELDGELFEDVVGALWTRDLIEKCRATLPLPQSREGSAASALSPGQGRTEPHWVGRSMKGGAFSEANPPPAQQPGGSCPRHDPKAPGLLCFQGGEFFRRVVIGVDPPASAEGDACGIVACGLGRDGIAYVLGDHSVAGLSPNGWAARVAAAAEIWGADRVIAEANNGGNMVGSVLASVDATLPVTLVNASRGKAARAEPVAARFEAGKAKFAGRFPELEDELAGMTAGGEYHGPSRSPDRADAMVWAMTELAEKARPEPRLRLL